MEKENKEEIVQEQDIDVQEQNIESGVQLNLTEEKGNKKKGKKVLLFGIILLLVAGFGCFYVLNQNNSKPTTKKNTVKKKDYYSDYRMSGNGLEKFDLYFLQLENEEKNKIYSPLSIKYALEMLAEGAEGNTKSQLDAVIGDYVSKSYPNNDHMSFANAMFIRNTFSENIKNTYTENLTNKYNAEVIYDEFESANNINNWVSNKTFKLIQNLVSDDKVKDANFYLVNALAIDMSWKNQIHCTSGNKVPCLVSMYSIDYRHEKIPGQDRAYHSASYPYESYGDRDGFPTFKFDDKNEVKSSEVLADFNRYDIIKELGEDNIRKTVTEEYKKWYKDQYDKEPTEDDVKETVDRYIEDIKENYGKAINNTDFLIYDDDTVKAFAKDLQEYDGINLQYIGIMPKEKKLTDYVNNVKVEDITEIIKNLKEMDIENFKDGVATIIRGNIPFFKFEYELKLMEDLQKLGIEDVFDINKSDLSKMLDNDVKQYINDAKHKTNIEFSNDGIKAAAATAMGGAGATGGGFEYLYEIPVEKIDMTFDKPYLFLIRDKDTGEVWFTGTVYEPTVK